MNCWARLRGAVPSRVGEEMCGGAEEQRQRQNGDKDEAIGGQKD